MCLLKILYTTDTDEINARSALDAVRGIERLLNAEGITDSIISCGYHYNSQILDDNNLKSVRCVEAGIYENKVSVGDEVHKGQLLAEITDPYEGNVVEQLIAPQDGIIFFQHKSPLIYASTAAIKLIV